MAGRGGARPGSGPKPVLTDIQRKAVAAECEARWLAERALKGKQPYRMRAQIIKDVAASSVEAIGIAVSPRMVTECWVELRARAKVTKAKTPKRARARAA